MVKEDQKTAPFEALTITAQQKVSMLELMLGHIANYCPVISRNTIVKNSTSMGSIWYAIRLHFGFEATGVHFLHFSEIHLESTANDLRVSTKDLWPLQRVTSFAAAVSNTMEPSSLKMNN